MPREDRRLYFDNAEIYQAIFGLCSLREMKRPPPGTVTAVTVKPEDDQIVMVKIENRLEGSTVDTEYSRDFFAAALMLYCRSMKIPLPKKAQKSVEITPENIIFRIKI